MIDSATSESIRLRPATPDDDAFLQAVYATTRAEEMAMVDWSAEQKADFVGMQFHAQHTFYHAEFPDASYDVLLGESGPVGRLYVHRRVDEIRILDIAILPEYRGEGIGTRLIQNLMRESAKSGRKLTLHVETFNRAQQLYARLGFKPVKTDGIYILVEWKETHENV